MRAATLEPAEAERPVHDLSWNWTTTFSREEPDMLTCTGSSCQHAVSPGCECGCGGGNHGALARISWATALAVPALQRTPEQKKQAETAINQRQRATLKLKLQAKSHRHSRQKPRRLDATVFFEANRSIDIVTWLINNPNECKAIESMAQQIGSTCESLLTENPGFRLRLADHFWCDVLAALVHVLTEVLNEIDKTPSRASKLTVDLLGARTWETVRDQRRDSKGNAPCQRKTSRKAISRADKDAAAGLHDAILEKTVKDLVASLIAGFTVAAHGTLDPIILRLRVLAILFCPDPYAHKAVWNYCVVPLLKQGIVIQAKNYLQSFYDMFKQQWSWPT